MMKTLLLLRDLPEPEHKDIFQYLLLKGRSIMQLCVWTAPHQMVYHQLIPLEQECSQHHIHIMGNTHCKGLTPIILPIMVG